MNRTYCLWRLFFTFAPQAAGSPLIDSGFTNENGGLERSGKCYVIRLPFTGHRASRGLVVGWWSKPFTGEAGPDMEGQQ